MTASGELIGIFSEGVLWQSLLTLSQWRNKSTFFPVKSLGWPGRSSTCWNRAKPPSSQRIQVQPWSCWRWHNIDRGVKPLFMSALMWSHHMQPLRSPKQLHPECLLYVVFGCPSLVHWRGCFVTRRHLVLSSAWVLLFSILTWILTCLYFNRY